MMRSCTTSKVIIIDVLILIGYTQWLSLASGNYLVYIHHLSVNSAWYTDSDIAWDTDSDIRSMRH